MGTGILALQRVCLFLSMVGHRIRALFTSDNRLHRARFARTYELRQLLSSSVVANGLLLGSRKARDVVCVQPTQSRRELGNLLVVAPTRGGKGLLATSQLLSWQFLTIAPER